MRQIRLPRETQRVIQNQMVDLREMEVIQDSRSPFNSPTFTVPKKDSTGRKTDDRVVHDYRKLNAHTLVQNFPMPFVWDLIDNFENCHYFSQIDIKSAFHQIPMHPDHQGYTAFSVGNHKYEYLRCHLDWLEHRPQCSHQ